MQSEMRAELRDWDLWGPLFICMSLAVMLSLKAHDEASMVFSVIFVIVWVGAAVVTVNGQLLGGRLYVHLVFLAMRERRTRWTLFGALFSMRSNVTAYCFHAQILFSKCLPSRVLHFPHSH